MLLIKESDGWWNFCVDYRELNEQTVKAKFPILMVEELMDELRGVSFFSNDIVKTVLRTHQGLFEFLVLPFGLTNTSTTFQALMNEVR
jgi:hypothetical protein